MKSRDALKKVEKGLRRLEKAGEGRVARKNARTEALAALRALRKAIDDEYPTVPKKSKPRPAKLTYRQHARRLQKRGWVQLHSFSLRKKLTDCGVPHKDLHDGVLWVPRWAAVVAEKKKAEIKRTVKSRSLQRAYNVIYETLSEENRRI
jgi:hypothetical protein